MKNKKLFPIIILIILIIVLLAIPSFVVMGKMGFFTSDPTAQVVMTAPEDAPKLVFVADYDFEPYSYLNEDGTPNGMDVEIAYELANRLGRRPQIEFGTWSECKEKIKNKEADVLLGLEIFVDGSGTGTLKSIPVGTDTLSIIGRDEINDAAALSGKRVGVSFGSALMGLFNLNCEYVEFFTYSEMLEALDKGEIDYCICHASVASKIIEKNDYEIKPSLVLMESFPTMGIRQDEPELQKQINYTLEDMSSDGTIAALRKKWIETYVRNRTVKDVLHNNEDFFVLYSIFAVFAIAAYVISMVTYRAATDRKSALKAAEEANKYKTNFLFSMSHDIRTPMNAILGFTNMAKKHIDDKEKVVDCLNKTQQSGNLLLSLINSVLDMSRIESGSAELDEEPGDVYLSYSNIEASIREMAETKDIKLTFEFGEITERYVYADYQRCIRVLTNLISNAIKYTNAGGFVRVCCQQCAPSKDGVAYYRYTIEDNGIGMSEEFKKHMFEVFTRERNTTTSGIQGTGLGLSVCKAFVDYMNGTIDCDSTLGKGTTFTVTLPFKVQKGSEFIDPVTGELISSKVSFANAKVYSYSGKRVLLAEDNELNREIATELLEEEGMVVEEAKDGSVAVNMFKEKGAYYYDYILMDIQMPVMNGYEATAQIRKLPGGDRVPIIALSANAFKEDVNKSYAEGMNAHVAKPIKIKELFNALEKFR